MAETLYDKLGGETKLRPVIDAFIERVFNDRMIGFFKLSIMGGQFARRLQILRETLKAYEVPQEIRDVWLNHTESLRSLITSDSGSDCDPELARKRVGKEVP